MSVFLKSGAVMALGLVWICAAGYALFLAPPSAFPKGSVVTVPSGSSIQRASQMLGEAHIVRSPFVFSLIARVLNPDGGVIANTYALPQRENAISLAYRLTNGLTGTTPVKVTIPEGLSAREIALILKDKLGEFDAEKFRTLGFQNEGYLFPETYYFLPGTSPEVVIKKMRDTFDREALPVLQETTTSGKSIQEVITMASLLEREARKLETRKIVSGILWKRIEIGMALQVDAVFGYIHGISGYTPTLDDYKVDSAYNTYLNRGLPPGPIANPGLEAIDAALHPTKTEYLYYLTGDDGNMYYSKTFAGHVANRVHLK